MLALPDPSPREGWIAVAPSGRITARPRSLRLQGRRLAAWYAQYASLLDLEVRGDDQNLQRVGKHPHLFFFLKHSPALRANRSIVNQRLTQHLRV
jgi:hypothetical protein